MGDSYATVGIVCGVVLQQDGKFLLVQEKKPSAYGLWNLPGGRADQGESFEETAVREAKEEVGFDVRIGEELLVVHVSPDKHVIHAFSAEIVGGELAFPEDEILDAQWFTYEEIMALKEKDLVRAVPYVIGAIEKVHQGA